jgi:hypothetical protein|tara:strand:+ start:1545 stop:2564 length:1020 start_codon:yes stop_codon:yes gene_type:complete
MIRKLTDFISLETEGRKFKEYCDNDIEIDDNTIKFFIKSKPNLQQKDFVKIDDLYVDFTCQRNPFRKERIRRMRTIAEHFNGLKVKRAQIAKIDGDDRLYIWDAMGRTIIANCLGFEYIPADICHFRDKNEMREFFLDQDTLDEKIHNWERHEIILKFKKEECPRRFIRFYNQAIDIQNTINECGLSIWTGKRKQDQMSVEKCWGYIKKCITNADISGNKGYNAGERNSYFLKSAIKILQKNFSTEKEIEGQLLEALVSFIHNEVEINGTDIRSGVKKINFIINTNKYATQKKFKEAIGLENVANNEIIKTGVERLTKLFAETRRKNLHEWNNLNLMAA